VHSEAKCGFRPAIEAKGRKSGERASSELNTAPWLHHPSPQVPERRADVGQDVVAAATGGQESPRGHGRCTDLEQDLRPDGHNAQHQQHEQQQQDWPREQEQTQQSTHFLSNVADVTPSGQDIPYTPVAQIDEDASREEAREAACAEEAKRVLRQDAESGATRVSKDQEGALSLGRARERAGDEEDLHSKLPRSPLIPFSHLMSSTPAGGKAGSAADFMDSMLSALDELEQVGSAAGVPSQGSDHRDFDDAR